MGALQKLLGLARAESSKLGFHGTNSIIAPLSRLKPIPTDVVMYPYSSFAHPLQDYLGPHFSSDPKVASEYGSTIYPALLKGDVYTLPQSGLLDTQAFERDILLHSKMVEDIKDYMGSMGRNWDYGIEDKNWSPSFQSLPLSPNLIKNITDEYMDSLLSKGFGTIQYKQTAGPRIARGTTAFVNIDPNKLIYPYKDPYQ